MTDTVTIERLGHLGDGIAPGPVFAARTLPGEEVGGPRDGDRISAPRILTPSDQRVSPPCRHYRRCGGCSLQHARDGFVQDWKQQVVEAALTAQGLRAPFRPSALSPPESRRRAVFAGRRIRSGALVGFHVPRSEDIVAVSDCRLVTPALRACLPHLEALVVAGGSRRGALSLAVLEAREGLDVAVTGGPDADAALSGALARLAGQADVARLVWNGEVVLQAAPPHLDFDGIVVPVPPGAFVQATVAGEIALRAAVAEIVDGARRIADLFAGCGTFALPLARAADVHAVEGDADLTQALARGWRGAPGLKAVTTQTRDLFRRPLDAADLAGVEAVVIDPPRAGAEAQARALSGSAVARIASVSCNPVTFARDAAILVAGGYRLDWVQIVDQFRWSTHIEVVAAFSRP